MYIYYTILYYIILYYTIIYYTIIYYTIIYYNISNSFWARGPGPGPEKSAGAGACRTWGPGSKHFFLDPGLGPWSKKILICYSIV